MTETIPTEKTPVRITTNGSASTGFSMMSLPKTGDAANVPLLVMLFLAGLGALVLITVRARKKD